MTGKAGQDYIALERLHLNVLDANGNVVDFVDKKPGELIKAEELEAAGQTADDIHRLTTEHLPAEPDEHGNPQHTEGIGMCTPDEYAEVSAMQKASAHLAESAATGRASLSALGLSDEEIEKTIAAAGSHSIVKKGGAA